jgi:probable phosphoglycerate mutase
MRLLVARHAHATSGPEHRVGPADQLTEIGRRQAAELARHLAALDERPALIFSSAAVRARQTADVCAAELGLEVSVDDRLCDRGGMGGRLPYTLREQSDDRPLDDVWHPLDTTWDGETCAAFWRRTADAARMIMERGHTSLVVCHLGTVTALARCVLDIGEDVPDAFSMAAPNASLMELSLRKDRNGRRRVSMVRSGDTRYLSDRTEG